MPLPRSVRPLLALCAALLLIGCGESVRGSTGDVSVAVTRDFGATPVLSSPPIEIHGSTPVTDVLDRVTDTREGTTSITSIDGVSGAWRLWVNGVRVRDAAKSKVKAGDRIWFDLPGGGVTASVPAVVGAFPEPFVHGVAGKRVPTRVECADPESAACDAVAERLSGLGVVAARGGIGAGSNDETIRVLVGTWRALRATRDGVVGRLDDGPARSGVFARFAPDGRSLQVLDDQGGDADELGAGTGLVAATKVGLNEPVWFVTGTDDAGVDAAASTLDEATLATDYALAVHDDRGVPVPAR